MSFICNNSNKLSYDVYDINLIIIIDNASINWLVNAARLDTNSLTVEFK